MLILKIVGVFVAVLVVAGGVTAAGMWRGFIPIPGPLLALLAGAKEPEYSARYYPTDTLAYAWATLTPGDGQFEDMRDIWGRFNDYPAFADLVDELKDYFEDETGIDFEADVMPWIGPEIAAAVIEIDSIGGNGIALDDGLEAWDDITIAVTIGVRDKDAAADFLDRWREYMARESDSDFRAGSHRGVDTWVDESKYQAYALTDDWLVYATDEDTLEEMLERIDGDGSDTLADDSNFKAARAALPQRRFLLLLPGLPTGSGAARRLHGQRIWRADAGHGRPGRLRRTSAGLGSRLHRLGGKRDNGGGGIAHRVHLRAGNGRAARPGQSAACRYPGLYGRRL